MYFFFIQMLWYQAFIQLLAWLFTAFTHSCLFCTDWIWNIISIYMNISHSHESSDSEIRRKLTSKEQLALRTSLTYSTSSANILVQTESLIMITQQTIQYLISFSVSDVSDASYFNESNVMRFLNQFKLLNENHEVKNVTLIKKLLKYYELRIQKEVKAQENYIMSNWEQLQ